MTRLLAITYLLVLIVVFATVVVLLTIIKISQGYHRVSNSQIPDTNGTSKSLCSIDTTYIESVTQKFDMIKHSYKQDSDNKSGVRGKFSDKDLSYSRDTAESLSGVYVCNAYLANGKTIHYTVSSAVNSGNLRIVITDSKNKILYDIPIDKTYYFEFDTVEGETYYLKIVGESANMTVTVMRSE